MDIIRIYTEKDSKCVFLNVNRKFNDEVLIKTPNVDELLTKIVDVVYEWKNGKKNNDFEEE